MWDRTKIIESLDLRDWTKTTEILDQVENRTGVRISARTWRSWKDEYNTDYRNGESKRYIVSTNRGYHLTTNKKLIAEDDARKRKQAYALLKRAYATENAIAVSKNMRLMFGDTDE